MTTLMASGLPPGPCIRVALMAKHKSKPHSTPLINTSEAGDKIIRTGIYTTKIHAESPPEVIDGNRLNELLALDLARLENDRETWQREARKLAFRFLDPFVQKAPIPLPLDPRDWPKGCSSKLLDFGDGPAVHFVRELDRIDTAGIIAAEALDLLERLDGITHGTSEAERIHAAFGAGRLFERLFVRTLESRALSQVKSSALGNAKKTADANKRKKKYRAEVTAEIAKQTKPNHDRACAAVAERHEVDISTVKDAVPNTWTRRPKK